MLGFDKARIGCVLLPSFSTGQHWEMTQMSLNSHVVVEARHQWHVLKRASQAQALSRALALVYLKYARQQVVPGGIQHT